MQPRHYKQPRSFNFATFLLLLLVAAGVYVGVQFGVPYYRSSEVKSILDNAASRLYQTSMIADYEARAREDEKIRNQTQVELRQAGIDDTRGDFNLVVDRTLPDVVRIVLEYTIVVRHPVVGKVTEWRFHREAKAKLRR
jgi:hypothetical protein